MQIYSTGISKRDLQRERSHREICRRKRATVEGSLKLHGDFRGILHAFCIARILSRGVGKLIPPVPPREG